MDTGQVQSFDTGVGAHVPAPKKDLGPFRLGGREYPYFVHNYNVTWLSERMVEIPVVTEFIVGERFVDVLEIGDVVHNYVPQAMHTVVDLYEKRDGVLQKDVRSFTLPEKFRRVISISTLEHVSPYFREIEAAVQNMRACLAPNGLGLITFPLFHCPALDTLVFDRKLGFSDVLVMHREEECWVETDLTVAKRSTNRSFREEYDLCNLDSGEVIGRTYVARYRYVVFAYFSKELEDANS